MKDNIYKIQFTNAAINDKFYDGYVAENRRDLIDTKNPIYIYMV